MRRVFLLATLLLAGCGLRSPIQHSVLIAPDETSERVTVSVTTEFASDLGSSREVIERVRRVRQAFLDGRDEWSIRFANVENQSERIAIEKQSGVLRKAEHSGVMPMDDLQRFFADTGVTIQSTRGEEWTELAIYAGASTRATREQRERVAAALKEWSNDARRYLKALHAFYAYIDREPLRAEPMFTLLFGEEKGAIEEEDALVRDLSAAMDRMVEHLEPAKGDAFPLDEEFDLVFNPLPGEIVLRAPSPIISSDGFERRGDLLVIRRASLIDALATLESRWITPDLLGMVIRSDAEKRELPDAEAFARMPRRRNAIPTPADLEAAFLTQLRPPPAYRARW
jgi:hypothetical protein